jgi:membrane protease YdiL (CAAX protease family)
MTKQTGQLTMALVGLWLAVAVAKAIIPNMFILHATLAVVFVFSGLLLIWRNSGGDRQPLARILRKPEGRLGYRLSMGYFLFTIALFAAFNARTWQDDVPRILDAAFANHSFVLAVVAAPLYEEFFFRGCLQPTLLNTLGSEQTGSGASNWSIYVSALTFWLFHMPLSQTAWAEAWTAHAIPISPGSFFLGIVCAFLADRERSIAFAVLFHFFANLLGPLWSGILPSSVLPFFYALN